jgi:RNA polymerase sigma-70 factor (ECF subfamily)
MQLPAEPTARISPTSSTSQEQTMPHPETEWLAGARRLDENVLAEIYDVLSPALYRYAYRLLGDKQSAEDVVGESFHRFLLALHSNAGPRQHLRAYLYRVAHNLAIDRYRRRPVPDLPLDSEADSPAADDDPALEVEHGAAQAEARAALWRLTPEQRQVIVLKYFEGLDNEEVAAALAKPVGAVKSLQHRALQSLRRSLELGGETKESVK